MSDKGRELLSEIREFADERTGARLWQVTADRSISHSLYFLTNSFLPDERSLVFASFRSGSAQFYKSAFPSGSIVQLTDSEDINSFSAILSPDGRELFFTRAGRIEAQSTRTLAERIIADFPGGKLGEVNLSPDGQWLVSAIRLGERNGIALAKVDGSGSAVIHHQDRTIIHPQFSRSDPFVIEYAADPAPRMFVINRDGTGNRCLYENTNDEFVVHETWLGDTGDIVFTVWPRALKRLHTHSGEITTIAEFNAWHICPSADGRRILCDTNCPDEGIQIVNVDTGRRRTVCYPQSSNRGSQWPRGRYALKPDFDAAAAQAGTSVGSELSWMEMKADTVYGPQWTHPHPAFSDSERYAAFTSDRTGCPQVYVVALPEPE
jgi:hypothetical protein